MRILCDNEINLIIRFIKILTLFSLNVIKKEKKRKTERGDNEKKKKARFYMTKLKLNFNAEFL